MNDKTAGREDRRQYRTETGFKITECFMQYLTAALAVALCVALAFYVSNGYYRIGEDKFIAYRNIMLTGSAALFAVLIPYAFFFLKEHRRFPISLTDGFVLAYLILSGISVVAGGFYKDALWGFPGWNMGLMSQAGFVLLYFFLSRFGKYYRIMLPVMCMTACAVYILGILNRLLIDPLGFYDGLTYYQETQFLSTLGQSSWYGSFLAVTLPVGIGSFLYADGAVWRAAGGCMMLSGFCTLVTQNSDSAYFALAGMIIVFFTVSSHSLKLMCRFMTMLTVLFASGKLMYFLMQLHPNPAFEPDFVTRLMWTSQVTWALLILCLAVTVLMNIMAFRGCRYPEALMGRLRLIVPVSAIVAAVGLVCVIILQEKGALPEAVSGKLMNIPYFNWGSQWGNSRGIIWSFSVKMFLEADTVHKLLGVGPDCFHSYVAARYSAQQDLYWGSMQLTNAHNEWMTSLINVGILGTIAYMGIYVTAIRRFFRKYRLNLLLVGITASCVSYMLYNFFCYQQVLCTPYVFMLMGTGEYILRQAVDETPPNG